MVIPVVLPLDIMEDIFSRLPLKSLQRFRCVSESCNSFISTQSFARMHVERALQSPTPNSQKILLSLPSNLLSLDPEEENALTADGAISRLNFPGKVKPPEKHPIQVVGSCHGLVCLALELDKGFFLWNPSTGDYNMLPDPCLLPGRKFPSRYEHCVIYSYAYGFGYDSSSDDYKVFFGFGRSWPRRIRGSKFKMEQEAKIGVFSMRENCWRIIEQDPPYPITFFETLPKYASFVSGSLNWLLPLPMERVHIVGFDLKSERFFEVPLIPKAAVANPSQFLNSGLGVLNGRLCLSGIIESDGRQRVELWVMNTYGAGESWSRLLNAPFEAERNDDYHTLCLSNDQVVLVNGGTKKLIRFDAQGTNFEELKMCECETQTHRYSLVNDRTCSEAIPYLESLISPGPNVTTKTTSCVDNQKRLRKRKIIMSCDASPSGSKPNRNSRPKRSDKKPAWMVDQTLW